MMVTYSWGQLFHCMRLWFLLALSPSLLVAQPKSKLTVASPNLQTLNQYGSNTTVLQDTSRFVDVGPRMGVLEDKTEKLTLNQVRIRTDFKQSTSKDFQYGFSNSAYWFRFELVNRNQENTKHWLIGLLDASTLDYVDLYLVYPQGQVRHFAGGLRRPYVDQGFFATTPFFRVNLPTDARVTAYFRIKSNLSMFGKVTVWEEYYNLSKGRVIIFAIWMFLGLFVLRSLNNFVLARFIPNPQFRFYAICTFLLYASLLSRTGIYPILFSNHPQLLDWMHYGMGRLLPLSLAAWMYNLLDNRRAFRPLRWLQLGIIGICGVGVILPFWGQTAVIGQFNASIVTLAYLLFFLNALLLWFTPQRTHLYFVLPIAFCTVPFFLYQLQSLSLIHYSPRISQLALVALAVEMISMSLVLGRIVQSYIKEQITTANALIREKVEVEKLHELDGLKTQFFTNISHEFRTPLTLILAPLGDLKKRYPAEPLLNLMERSGQRLLNLINQLLDLSKLEAGQSPTETNRMDMAAFFRAVASSFDSLATSRQIAFRFQQDKTEFWVYFDQDKLEKIVTNLLSNAFKFTPVGRQVTMHVQYNQSAEATTLELIIKDTGIGIPASHVPHIFERFYQVDSRANRSYEGTGIGLALVYELVTVLGGKIDVSSAEGIGTTFTIHLPLLIAPAESIMNVDHQLTTDQRLADEPVQQTSVLDNLTPTLDDVLLIVDDNADIRAYIRSIFAEEYRILEANHGLEGLEKVTAHLPDVIICDLMMPRLDGFAFCKAVKSQTATSHIPVVMLTAKATTDDRIEGFELGADDYLTKPFIQAELKARVRNLMRRQAQLRQYLTGQQPVAEPPQDEQIIKEDAFLQKARAVIDTHLGQADFNVELFSEQLNLSQSQLVRKLKALTGETGVEFLRNHRLDRAAEKLRSGESRVSEVAYGVGFESLSYFTRVFQDRFGVTPSAYKSPILPNKDQQ